MEASAEAQDAGELGTIETRIPARLDRFPWSRFHLRVVIGLGIVWILDGLEVTIVGFLAPTLVGGGAGIDFTNSDVAAAQSIYVAGACLGALFFGQLTDRFGRKNLFLVTLGLYLIATVLAAASWTAWWFLAMRFFTGAGIGGEYAAINSAIDELIPARARGRTDLIINGSFWVGAAAGGLASIVLLQESLFALDVGWRLAFALGATLGLGILFLRRTLPESPRWLFIHGHEEEAERIVDEIEREVGESTGQELSQPDESITVRQRRRIPWRDIARTVFKTYPKRAVLGLSLFVGQAFIYNRHGHARDHADHLLWRRRQQGRAFLRRVRRRKLPGAAAPRPALRHCRQEADDRRDVSPLGIDARWRGRPLRRLRTDIVPGPVHRLGADPGAGRHLLLRVGRRELRVPDRERGLPDGDPGAGDRLLLRDRNGHWRDHRSPGVRASGLGRHEQRRDRLPHRCSRDGVRRHRRAVPGRTRRAAAGSRTSPSRSPPRTPSESEAGEGLRRLRHPRTRRTDVTGPAPIASDGACGATGPARAPRLLTLLRLSRRAAPGVVDNEVAIVVRALQEHGELSRDELARRTGARYRGPGRFGAALREALNEGTIRRVSRSRYALADAGADSSPGTTQPEPA